MGIIIMKKRIAFISEHASPLAALGGVDSGGQNVYVGELAKQLTTNGFEVDIFTRWDNPQLPRIITWVPDVRVIHVEAGPLEIIEKEKLFAFMPKFAQKMIEFIAEEQVCYGLIHANFWMSAMVASELKKVLNIPFIVTFHALGFIRKMYQGDNDKFPPERIEIEKQIVREADQIIAECPQDKCDLIEHYDAPVEKITIVPCGFNSTEFYPMDKTLARMVVNIDASEHVILQLGRVVPRKGIDNVIRAMGKLKNCPKPVRLYIVGGETDFVDENNPEIRRLKQVAEEEGVSASITFTGRMKRDMLKYYYSAADIFITTPWYEPFGITPLEAMACGTPVIGSDVGGIKYSVEDGETGYLVPANDPVTLAEKVTELLNDEALILQMRANALKRVNSMFTWSKVADLMTAVYERVLLLNPTIDSEQEADLTFIEQSLDHLARTVETARQKMAIPILHASSMVVKCFQKNKKILVCGNGGSAAESQHLVAELVGRFDIPKRAGLPAISLTADTAILTAWSNDIGFEDIFARQVDAYGQKGDILFCFSTSGESQNVINAMKRALEKNMYCIALTGKGGGEMGLYAHVNVIVPSANTQRIQELHLHILHTICSLVESRLFRNKKTSGRVDEKAVRDYSSVKQNGMNGKPRSLKTKSNEQSNLYR
jgi:D-inositol-3-phosphate glycosyltransferase